MAKWKIELRGSGRDRTAGTITVDAENLVKAKRHTMRVCRRRLSAGKDVYLEAKGRRRYGILLDADEVGEATITCLEPEPAGKA
ncbi:MAG: hypothetical protein ACM3VT_01595 [Solirubrobacterales bacterium]